MKVYTPTIGLEIHAELKTETKMFCRSKNAPHESEANTHVCPVCLAHPGTLPVVNRKAVESVLRVGVAVGGTLADYSEFDRKSYFYPDIPKSYQISQYEYPLVSHGSLEEVAITRIHLEEDTARSSHDGETSLVDFNRAGVPLMELVTEPVIRDAKTASRFAKELQLTLRTLDVSEANLEKGEMRVEANISVSPDETFGTKVEVKNLNSFKAVERAIDYEIQRHIDLLEKGEVVIQETRGWDEDKQKTFSQRAKEGSTDYRYFPEPDIPKMHISEVPEWSHESLLAIQPELPREKRARLVALGIREADADTLVSDVYRSRYFESLMEALEEDTEKLKIASNYLVNDLGGMELPEVMTLANLVELIANGFVSSKGAKELLPELISGYTDDVKSLAESRGLAQVSDPDTLSKAIEELLEQETDAVAQYKSGKENALQYLLGALMRATKGSANPVLSRKLLIERLSS